MLTCRHRAPVLHPINSLTAEQHAEIQRLVVGSVLDWSTTGGVYGGLIAKFRAEVKDYYYRWQRRRCCYCSVELQDHKITYDAEHILDKAGYPEYMFETGNIAASCKLCNQYKSNKSISVSGQRFAELSKNTDDYSIVHPHLDEWSHHLRFDIVGRIVANAASQKGRETIRVCGMVALNAARLADQFAIEETEEAETALRTFHEVDDVARKRELLDLLGEMAQRFDHPGSRAVMDALRMDFEPPALEGRIASPAAIEPNGVNYLLSHRQAPDVPAGLLPAPVGMAPVAPEARDD